MGIVDHDKLRSNYLGVVEKLGGNHAAGLVHPYVSAETIEDVSVRSSFIQYDREFTFFGDEAFDRGGQERGPSPIRYFLSGIAFCMLGWYAKGAAFADCEVEGLGMSITTHLDLRGEHGFEDKPVHIQWLVFDVHVESPSPADSVLAMVDWGDARCPLGAFSRRAVPVYTVVNHNGTVIRDTVPHGVQHSG